MLIKKPLIVLLAIIFFPFFFTWWVYKRDWNPKIKWAFMLSFWLLIFIAEITNTPQKEVIPRPASQASTTPASHTSPSPVTTITYPPFDNKHGNNFISAKYAKQYVDFAAKVAPGAIKDVYLELSPVDPAGMTEEAYKKSISDTSLTITVNSFYWNNTNDSTKKNLIATCINTLKNTFSGYPHLIVNDGTKTIATGELPSLNGTPKVTLK